MAETAQLLNPGGASSSISHSKLEEPDHSSSNWYFTREAIERSSPSRKDGIDLKKETYLRKSYCTFLQDLGMRLKVPQVTIATAIVFCHRFFLRQSHHKNDRYMIATVCMFLAGKVEETPKPLRDVIYLSYEIRFKKDPAAVQRIKQKEVYEQQKELVLLGERLVLSTLGFDLNIHHPYKPLVAAIKKFKVAQNALAQVAWNFVNDGLRTSLCLQFKPHHIAAGAIFLAAKFLKVKLPSDENKVWWQEFDVTPRQLEEVSNQMLELYEQNREAPASRASDPSASADASKQFKPAPIPPKAGEAQASANGPACAPGKFALQQEAILRREDDGQVPSRSGMPSVSNQAKQVHGAVEVGKGQLQEAGSKEPWYGTKPVPSGSMRLADDAGRSTTFTEVKQYSGVNEPGKEQVYGGVPFQQVSLSRSIDNGVMKHGSPMEHEMVRDMAGKYDANVVSNHRMSRFSEEDQKYNAGDTRVVDRRFAAGSLNTDDERYVVQNDSVSNGFGQNRQEFSERHESLQVGAKADIKVTGADKLKLGVDDREEKKNLPSFDGMPNIKAALEKRRKLKEENLEGRLVVSKAELTDEEELLERELEFGVEAAVKEERTKQDRKDNRAKLLQRHEHEDWQPQRELNEDNEGGNKRKRLYEESQYSDRKTKPHERADSFEGEHETLKDGLLDHTDDGELHGAAGQEQVISTRTDKRNHQASSPLWKRDHGSRDIHGHRDGSYDNKQRGHNRDYYHQPNSQHSHRVDGEKEHRHHKDRERQDREHKKARYDYGK